MYKVFYHRRVQKQFRRLTQSDRKKVAEKIKLLSHNPNNPQLNIAPYLEAKKSWRIRIGNLRAIYTIDKNLQTILVEYLGFRGSVYKGHWLM